MLAAESGEAHHRVMGRIVIYGAGGFGREVITAARMIKRVVLADGRPVESDVIRPEQIDAEDEIAIAISDPTVRRSIAAQYRSFTTIFAPTAVIGRDVEIGIGSIFCDHSMVTVRARIGRHFHCNIYSYVAHDCVIGDFVTFAPRVCCNGNVHIGDGAYIGTGAVIRQGHPERPLTIGAGAVVGMGAVVTKDVPPGMTVVGNPAAPMPLRLVG